jgi:4-hydroxy-tetrahydrodipicolinate reductase
MLERIGLIGYGQMGKMVEKTARHLGIEVGARFDDVRPFEENETVRQALDSIQVMIDFSVPDIVMENIRLCTKWSMNMVIGTTGWHDNIDRAREAVEKSGIGVVYASNFSPGVNLFYKLIRYATELFSRFEGYDPFMVEQHHQFKKDAPSGTALSLKRIMEAQYTAKPVPVTSVRAGFIPGTHSISFDSRADTIEVKHTARNREGFAEGALLAAKWIEGKKGFYSFGDILESLAD